MQTPGIKTPISIVSQFADIVGSEYVSDQPSDLLRYQQSTGERERNLLGVVRPATVAETTAVVKMAAKKSVALYPISTGRNWGYGTAKPVTDNCVILDLSRMNTIVEFDHELGMVTLEPGVTQEQLYAYITKHQLPYIVPTTGAGPNTSILGNILERGYGLAPYSDHFSAVTSIEAILPDGSYYKPALAELGAYETEKTFKYGLGPYLDGIFTQSNLGVVVQVSLLLKKVSPRTDLFLFWVDKKEDLEKAVIAIRDIASSYESIVPTIKLVSQLRSFAVSHPYPKNLTKETGTLDLAAVEKIAKRALITPWVGIGIITGETNIVKAARVGVRKKLRNQGLRYALFGQTLMKFVLFFTKRYPLNKFTFATSFNRVADVLAMFKGKPDFTEHRIDYWKSGHPFLDTNPDPARDGTGLFWYAPLVPMKPPLVKTCVESIENICRKYGIEPLIAASAVSCTCFDITTYLLFDATNPIEVQKAHECYEELFVEGRSHGFLPYRLNIDFMDLPEKIAPNVWRLTNKLKKAIDPKGIIAPGRYSSIQTEKKTKRGGGEGIVS